MAGKGKYAERMAKHLNEPIEAACPITRPGGTKSQLIGGVAGAALAGRGKTRDSDVQIGQFGWLGLGATHFAITKASMMGKPTGDPLARIAYGDVTAAELTEGKLTLRVDLDVNDGRHVAFEAKRLGQGKPSVEVLESLRDRCAAD
jgi:hypothetical protein